MIVQLFFVNLIDRFFVYSIAVSKLDVNQKGNRKLSSLY